MLLERVEGVVEVGAPPLAAADLPDRNHLCPERAACADRAARGDPCQFKKITRSTAEQRSYSIPPAALAGALIQIERLVLKYHSLSPEYALYGVLVSRHGCIAACSSSG